MDNIEIVGQIVFIIFFLFAGTFGFLYVYNWQKLRRVYKEQTGKPLVRSQKEINDSMKEGLDVTAGLIAEGMKKGFWTIFIMKTDNPEIRKPLKALRRTLLAAFLIPILMVGILFVWALVSVGVLG